MNISERKRRILRALATENIKTAEPVSSQVLSDRYLCDLSSATIRNELASMEEQGIISKTHTSSGRVPTTLGFQLFIDEILPYCRPTAKELSQIRSRIETRVGEMENIVSKTAEALSEVCDLPTVVLSGISPNAIVESVKIFPISDNECFVVVKTSEGYLKDIATSAKSVNVEACESASIYLTKTISGLSLGSINKTNITAEFESFKEIIAMLFKVIENQQSAQIATSGHSKLIDKDSKSAKAFLELVDNKPKLKEVIGQNKTEQLSVSLTNVDGAECAVVSASLRDKSGKPLSIAVMGPARMDYEKVIKAVRGLSKILDEEEG